MGPQTPAPNAAVAVEVVDAAVEVAVVGVVEQTEAAAAAAEEDPITPAQILAGAAVPEAGAGVVATHADARPGDGARLSSRSDGASGREE